MRTNQDVVESDTKKGGAEMIDRVDQSGWE
jgi:hypothetical protein